MELIGKKIIFISQAYGAPKVHKQETLCPYRLVVSNSRTKMFRVSKWFDIHLQIICKRLKTYL